MPLISASIITKEGGGRLLLSRHFVDGIPKESLERNISFFSSLLKERSSNEEEEEGCYIDSGRVRYFFRSINAEYLVVLLSYVTPSSSMPQEIEALNFCYRLVEQYLPKQDSFGEDGVPIALMANSLEIILSWDEVIASGLGIPENIDWSSLAQSLEMESAEELIQEAILKEQERETKDLAKKKLKQIEIDRKENGGKAKIAPSTLQTASNYHQPSYQQQQNSSQYSVQNTHLHNMTTNTTITSSESGGMKFGTNKF